MAVDNPERPKKNSSMEVNAVRQEKQNEITENTEGAKEIKKAINEAAASNYSSSSRDTNSSDPESVRCRVFIGNLNTDKINRDDLKAHFSEFGTVLGCSLHTNFGFVQFGSRVEADKAVTGTHGTTLFGKRVDANIASERRKPHGKDRQDETTYSSGRSRKDQMGSPKRYRSRSPRSPRSQYDEPYHGDDTYKRSYKQFSRNYYDDQKPRNPYERPDSYSQQYDTSSKDYYRNEQASSWHGNDKFNAEGRKRRYVECEIIATSAELSGYGNSIEYRLRAMGISASIMFPPADVSIADIMDRIAREGCLYAVVISTQNEYHRSCTLNILHGAPQEHRNMPLDDALAFVARNFNQYLNDSKDRHEMPLSSSSKFQDRQKPAGKTILTQDAYISGILNLAAAGKPLKVLEVNHLIEALIKYKNEIEAVPGASHDSQHPEYLDNESFQPGRTSDSTQNRHVIGNDPQGPTSSSLPPVKSENPYIGYPGYFSSSQGF